MLTLRLPLDSLAIAKLGKDVTNQGIEQRQSKPVGAAHSELDLAELFNMVKSNWKIFGCCLTISFVMAFAFLFYSPPQYDISMTVGKVPEETPQYGGSSSLLSDLAVFGGGSSAPLLDRFEETLTSWRVANALVENHNVMQKLFASQWDSENNVWLKPSGVKDWIRTMLYSIFSRGPLASPDAFTLQEEIRRRLAIESADSDILRISFVHKDPALAAEILNKLYFETEAALKSDAAEIASARILHIENELQKSLIAQRKTILVDMLFENQMKLVMAGTTSPYASQMLDPPQIPHHPSNPSIRLTFVVFLFLGFSAGTGLAVWYGSRNG